MIAIYRAQRGQSSTAVQSEISEGTQAASKVYEVLPDNKHDDSRSDTSCELSGPDSDDDVQDGSVQKMDASDGEGFDGRVIGTLSEIPENKVAEKSLKSPEGQCSTKDTNSECKVSDPVSTPKSEMLLCSLQEINCEAESTASLLMNKRKLRDIAVKDIKKEPLSPIFVPTDTDEEIFGGERKAEKDVSFHNFVVKSPEMIDISHDDSTEDYGEKSMEEPTGSQMHGDNGQYIIYFISRIIWIYYDKGLIMANNVYKFISVSIG